MELTREEMEKTEGAERPGALPVVVEEEVMVEDVTLTRPPTPPLLPPLPLLLLEVVVVMTEGMLPPTKLGTSIMVGCLLLLLCTQVPRPSLRPCHLPLRSVFLYCGTDTKTVLSAGQ